MKQPEDTIVYMLGDNVNGIEFLWLVLFYVYPEKLLIGKQKCFSRFWRSLGGYDLGWREVVENKWKEMFWKMWVAGPGDKESYEPQPEGVPQLLESHISSP